VATEPSEIAERLAAIGEELADLALDRLRQAADAVRSGGEPDPEVEKAARLLEASGGVGLDEGP
jgi:hypothetical protein